MTILATAPAIFLACASLLGLIIGSFLNVVIHRLPHMLEADWRANAEDILDVPATSDRPRFNLAYPGSACPKCNAPIRIRHNIPIVSFIALQGRCAACRSRISVRYLLVEIGAASLAATCAWHFGPTIACALAMVLSWALLTLTVIDWNTQLLPDNITLPLLWAGLLASTANIYTSPRSAIIGAAGGYLLLWLVFHLFRLVTGKQGMGHGDFKLLAALGAWLGWQQLPIVVLLASATGAIVGLTLLATGRLERDHRMPFGPFLAAAGWLSLIAGDTMLQHYPTLAGLI